MYVEKRVLQFGTEEVVYKLLNTYIFFYAAVSHLDFEWYCYPVLAGPANIYKK